MDVSKLDRREELRSCKVLELEGCSPTPGPPPSPCATEGAKTDAEDMDATDCAELRLYPLLLPGYRWLPPEFFAE